MPENCQPPRVSVVIPCYHASMYVGDTLKSVFSQTYHDFEVVLVNDGSPDAVALQEVIAPWMDKIVYLEICHHGPSVARNTGILAAKGELVAFLDADDQWDPSYLEVQVQKLDENPSADIVYPGVTFFGDYAAGHPLPVSRGEVTFASVIDQSCIVLYSVLARRQAIIRAGLFDPGVRAAEDFDLWLRCIKTGSRIIYHNKPIFHYRVHKGSLSSDPVLMNSQAARVLQKLRTTVEMTTDERRVLEVALRKFKGLTFFCEGKHAFLVEDFTMAEDRLRSANKMLPSIRNFLVLQLVRVIPRLTRAFYVWNSSHRNSTDTECLRSPRSHPNRAH